MTKDDAQRRATKGIAKGLLKTISKMGISTIPSYCGAQVFEAIGLSRELVDRHFTGTASRIGGIGIEALAGDTLARHARAYPGTHDGLLPVTGLYSWRREGEHHQWNPETIALLQHAVRHGGFETYEEYAQLVNDDSTRRSTLRGLMRFREAPDGGVPIEEVEPAQEIVKRFATGAMSLGSLSREAHETLAVAMNRIGGRSNTGEGGEDPVRYVAGPERGLAALGDQAGGVRPLRRERALPRERGRAADQDGAGREARRGRPAAGPQGRPLHRERATDHARRRSHLAAAAPRHLLDRGSQAADLRPALRESRARASP